MTIMGERGGKRVRRPKPSVDEVLRLGRAIGWRRLGMVMLYYRAGMKQEEIARVFGVDRQTVAYQLRRAFEIVSERRDLERKCRPVSWRNVQKCGEDSLT
jgi:hypothetical protein